MQPRDQLPGRSDSTYSATSARPVARPAAGPDHPCTMASDSAATLSSPQDASAADHAPTRRGGFAGLWARYKLWVVPAFALLVLAMLLSHAHKIDWAGAWEALKQYKLSLLAAPATVL